MGNSKGDKMLELVVDNTKKYPHELHPNDTAIYDVYLGHLIVLPGGDSKLIIKNNVVGTGSFDDMMKLYTDSYYP